MNDVQVRMRTVPVLFLFILLTVVFLMSMQYRLGPEVADDGAFFLRYAENMVKGEFWVWNLGEAPVWGASAPLFPLLVAAPIALGVPPITSLIAVSMALSAVSLSLIVLMLGHRFGIVAGLAFFVFASLDTGMMYFSGAGLESPLTIALLAAALWALLYGSNGIILGVIAGLLAVNKLDLLPVAGLLIAARWLETRNFPWVAVVVAGTISAVWYGFAWLYFGAPVPNSFLTKSLHQDDLPKSIDWTWFAGFVFWTGIHKKILLVIPFIVLLDLRRLAPTLLFIVGTLVIHTIAYTIKYPFEPYNWYAMPSLFSLMVLAALGLSGFANLVSKKGMGQLHVIAPVALLVVLFVVSKNGERIGTTNIKNFSAFQEYDRSEAGRWVAKNTPADFTVYTMWGNPAYYSQRKVLDGSFLNRQYEEGDLIKTYRPEIVILQNNPGSTPMAPVFAATNGDGYKIVKVFEKSFTAGMDYFFAVLAREDIIDQISEIDPPRDLMPRLRDISLGDKYGILEPFASRTLFVHPGLSTPTTFTFDAADYVKDVPNKTIEVTAEISPLIPPDAVARGAGDVRLHVWSPDQQYVDQVIKFGKSYKFSVSAEQLTTLKFSVDSHGSPDTDWLLLSIR
ncbi:hypothetical protein ACWKW9_23720 [Rhizobium daejeonense]